MDIEYLVELKPFIEKGKYNPADRPYESLENPVESCFAVISGTGIVAQDRDVEKLGVQYQKIVNKRARSSALSYKPSYNELSFKSNIVDVCELLESEIKAFRKGRKSVLREQYASNNSCSEPN